MRRLHAAAVLTVLSALGCGSDMDGAPDGSPPDLAVDAGVSDVGPFDAEPLDTGPWDTGPPDTGAEDAGIDDLGPNDVGPRDGGFIGSACASATDCAYAGAACLTTGFEAGVCTLACEQFCPDSPGYALTFCVEAAALPPEAAALGNGACFSRCDFALFPGTGCRAGYGCRRARRAGSDSETFVCLPGPDELSSCHTELASLGLGFEPTVVPDAHPAPPNDHLTCRIEEPVFLFAPIAGVELIFRGVEVSRFVTSCEGAKAVAATMDDLGARDVVSLEAVAAYSCRVIAGTSTLSRHAYGDAFDVLGVSLEDGTTYTLLDDWEVGTSTPTSPGGVFLFDLARRIFDAMIWNVVLTPNYDVAHEDHLHLDLTPGRRFFE